MFFPHVGSCLVSTNMLVQKTDIKLALKKGKAILGEF